MAAPVAVLPVAHVDEVHLVVLRPHDVAHGPAQRSPRLHAAQPPGLISKKKFLSRVSARYLFSISILIFGNLHTYPY